jgi:hypothetical protein
LKYNASNGSAQALPLGGDSHRRYSPGIFPGDSNA